nr:MAG TPA: protein of unknown function (DUF4494) [Caudoviricetes sp.]
MRQIKLIRVSMCCNEAQPNGAVKPVNLDYYMEAETFGRAEEIAVGDLGAQEVRGMSRVSFADYKDYSDGEAECGFFKVLSDLVTVNEATGKEKKTRIVSLAKGRSVESVTEISGRRRWGSTKSLRGL